MKLRTAICGNGKVGHFHARALQELESSDFVAVAGHHEGRVSDFADQYGIEGYLNIATMVRQEKVDVVCICTPHPTHRELALQAIEAGASVLIEKPLAMTSAECDDILHAAEAQGVQVGTIAQRRYYEPCMRMARAIEEGRIGTPMLGSVTMLGWRDREYYESDAWRGTWEGEGGGVLVNQAPHQIDLLLWFMGEAQEVYGVWRNINHEYLEVEDTAVATVKFSSGGVATILVSNSQDPAIRGTVHVHGSNGASIGVQTDGGQMFVAGVSSIAEAPYNDMWTIRGEEDVVTRGRQEDEAKFFDVDPHYHFHMLQISDFISSVSAGEVPFASGIDGKKTVS